MTWYTRRLRGCTCVLCCFGGSLQVLSVLEILGTYLFLSGERTIPDTHFLDSSHVFFRFFTQTQNYKMQLQLGSLHGTRTCPWCMSWPFGTYSLWWDALPSPDARGRGLVLPQLYIPCCVDSCGGLTPSEWGQRRSG